MKYATPASLLVNSRPSDQHQGADLDLVSFEHPPVQEVALCVQFPTNTFGLESFGAFATATKASLPIRQNQLVLPQITEAFDDIPTATPPFQLRLEPATTLPRIWFMNDAQSELAQLQHDRLTLNWRRIKPADDYPRYKSLRRRFIELLDLLLESLKGVGQPAAPNQCEVTYVNSIEMPGQEPLAKPPLAHPNLSRFINRVRSRNAAAFLPEPEGEQFSARWRIPATKDDLPDLPVGRLYLNATPQLTDPGFAPIYRVDLTARVVPFSPDRAGALEGLDLAHKWVVLGFKDVTTDEMHSFWGLKEPKP